MAKNNKQIIPEGECQIDLFRGKEIRKVFHENEWYFSIIDVIAVLTRSAAPSNYWKGMKTHDLELATSWEKFKLPRKRDGKLYPSECATVEDISRIVQSIPSPKSEKIVPSEKQKADRLTGTSQKEALLAFLKVGPSNEKIKDND